MVRTAGYLSAAKLLHAITVVELLAILAIDALVDAHLLTFRVLAMLCLFPLFTQLDARSRFQEYKKIKDQLFRYGPDRRIFKSVARSRCQRDAALAASRQLGYATECRIYFTNSGYRWYHLLPGFVKAHPCHLISAVFWRTTFFTPTYPSRTRPILDFRKHHHRYLDRLSDIGIVPANGHGGS